MKRENVEIQFEPVLLYEANQGHNRVLSITIVPSSISDTAVYQRSEFSPEE
jgi:hypothetical protein